MKRAPAQSLSKSLMAVVPFIVRRSHFCSFPEDGSAHTDAGRSFFNCDFEIVGHAHGKMVHGECWEIARSKRIAQLAQFAEVVTRAFGIVRERRYGHESEEGQCLQARRGHQHVFELLGMGRYAALGGFTADVDLDEYIQFLSESGGCRVELLGQL